MSKFSKKTLPRDGFWHVAVFYKNRFEEEYDIPLEKLLNKVVIPYRAYQELFVGPHKILRADITQIAITHTVQNSSTFKLVKRGTYEVRDVFNGVNGSEDYQELLTENGFDSLYVSDLEYKERLAKAQSQINVVQTQNQTQTLTLVQEHYAHIDQFIELFAELVKDLKHKNGVSSELLSEGERIQETLDAIDKGSEKSFLSQVLRKAKRFANEVKDFSELASGILVAINKLKDMLGM